jgi:hypothetical protein
MGYLDVPRSTLILLSMCPHCGRDAPIVYRGALPYCTACGGLRPPLSSPSVNLAGKPSKVGGAVASVIGWLVLLIGLSTALGLGLLIYALVTAAVALAIAAPIALVVLVLGIALVKSGHALRRSGADAERATREQALLGLAAHRGAVTAADAARALDVGMAEADAMLTALAKREPERIAVDIDEQGVVRYRAVAGVLTGQEGFVPRARVLEGLRVDEGPTGRPAGSDAEVEDVEEPAELRR